MTETDLKNKFIIRDISNLLNDFSSLLRND